MAPLSATSLSDRLVGWPQAVAGDESLSCLPIERNVMLRDL